MLTFGACAMYALKDGHIHASGPRPRPWKGVMLCLLPPRVNAYLSSFLICLASYTNRVRLEDLWTRSEGFEGQNEAQCGTCTRGASPAREGEGNRATPRTITPPCRDMVLSAR